MKKQYLIGGNALNFTVPDDLAAWQAIEPRYAPFATDETVEPVLEVEIRAEDVLPDSEN